MASGRLARLLLIPALAGLLASGAAYAALGTRPAVPAELALVDVVTVRENVPVRSVLTDQHLTLRKVPADLAAGAATSPREAAGRMNQVPLVAGEILLRDKLVAPEKAALPYRIPEGRRAVSFQVDEFSGVAGHVDPGDRVDLVAIFPEKQGTGGARIPAQARLLLQDVLVLERGPRKGPVLTDKAPSVTTGRGVTSITLALTPAEAMQAALAERAGEMKLLLRPARPDPLVVEPGIDESDVRGGRRN